MIEMIEHADTDTDTEDEVRSSIAGDDLIVALIENFHSKDGLLRQRSRRTLTDIGRPAVPALIDAMEDAHWRVRWEAAKTLKEIGDPRATFTLLKALEDSRGGIRWLAAEGLVAIGESALIPLLQELLVRPESMLLREGAHHVVRKMIDRGMKEELSPLRDALNSQNPRSEVPLAAEEALIAISGVAPRISRPRGR